MRNYDGTLLVISHDRYFLDRLVNRVIEIKNGQLYDYPGNYSYYLSKRKQYHPEGDEDFSVSGKTNNLVKAKTPQDSNSARKSKQQKREEAEARKIVSKERNILKKRIDEIEAKLDLVASRKTDIEIQLANPETYNDPTKSAELNKEHKQIEIKVRDLEDEWEEKHLELDELLSSL